MTSSIDLRPKFGIALSSDSDFRSRSPTVWMPARLRQLYERTPSSSSSIKAVAVLEQSYTVAAIAGTAWLKSGLATPAQAQQLETLNDAVHAELVAARTAAENGNSVTIVATYTALTQGLQAFQAFETANKIGVTP